MNAARDAAFSLYDELAAADPDFKTLFDSWSRLPGSAAKWFGLAEASIINFAAASAG